VEPVVMSTALLDMPMTEDKTKTTSVKLTLDVVKSARIVSAFRGEPMAEMLSDLLRPILARMEQEEMTKRSKGAKGKAT
jgi:hypothetical protein